MHLMLLVLAKQGGHVRPSVDGFHCSQKIRKNARLRQQCAWDYNERSPVKWRVTVMYKIYWHHLTGEMREEKK